MTSTWCEQSPTQKPSGIFSRWDWPEDSLYHGRDGAVLFNEHFHNQFSELSSDVVEVEELDHGAVFIHVRHRGIGRASGAAVERDVFQLVRMRDGLVWRGMMPPSRAEAIAAGNAPYGPSESSRV